MNPTYTLKITTKSTLLTHLPLDKMVAILANYNFKCIFLNENDRIPIRISLKFVPMSPIYNKSALVQVMARCRTGDKPLSEPMLTHFTDAYMPHQGDMSWGWSKWAVFCRQLAEIWSYTPLWKSNRNLFSTQIFYHLFFVVCSSFYIWYIRGGQYQISKFLLDFDHWLYFSDILKKVTGSKPDVALVWFMQWAKMELEHGEKHRYCRIVRV